jgi:muconolactone delta-isomerase
VGWINRREHVVVLVICRPAADVNMQAFARLLPDEMEALRRLRQSGALTNAWSPGRPGAILMLDADIDDAEDLISALPLARAGMLDYEIAPLLLLSL